METIKKIIKKLIQKYSIAVLNISNIDKINLCSGDVRIPGYFNIDFIGDVDLKIDLEIHDLPFKNNSIDTVICMSAINYFSYGRAKELICEIFRALRVGGIVRFGTQDLEVLSLKYAQKDESFFNQKLANGKIRFEGDTIGDKYVAWFYGYEINDNKCRYFYDYDSLRNLFVLAGFTNIEKKLYLERSIQNIVLIDNRPDQMFFLEAIK